MMSAFRFVYFAYLACIPALATFGLALSPNFDVQLSNDLLILALMLLGIAAAGIFLLAESAAASFPTRPIPAIATIASVAIGIGLPWALQANIWDPFVMLFCVELLAFFFALIPLAIDQARVNGQHVLRIIVFILFISGPIALNLWWIDALYASYFTGLIVFCALFAATITRLAISNRPTSARKMTEDQVILFIALGTMLWLPAFFTLAWQG